MLRQFALQRRDAVFLDLRTFRAHTFSLSIVMFSLAMLMMFGFVITMPIYMQYGLLQPTFVIGLVLLPGGLLMGLLGPFVGRLYDRFGPRPLVIVVAALLLRRPVAPEISDAPLAAEAATIRVLTNSLSRRHRSLYDATEPRTRGSLATPGVPLREAADR